jgi:enoyl-CoA hydratase/carnithine racemase
MSTVYQFLAVSILPSTMTITLNRPEVLNAINTVMQGELQDALDRFAADPDLRVCVLTGAGTRAFCAGSDLKELAQRGLVGSAPIYPRSGYGGIAERFDLNKPVIAAVNGLAYGGGFEIALSCDLIVASETARFGLPEPRVGGIAVGGGVHRLVRQIGIKRALRMILTGGTITAHEAKDFGLVNIVTDQVALMPAVDQLVNEILSCSPAAIMASKEAAYRGLDEPTLAAAIAGQSNFPAYQEYLASPDRHEGPRAFAQKRRPNWSPA